MSRTQLAFNAANADTVKTAQTDRTSVVSCHVAYSALAAQVVVHRKQPGAGGEGEV